MISRIPMSNRPAFCYAFAPERSRPSVLSLGPLRARTRPKHMEALKENLPPGLPAMSRIHGLQFFPAG